MKLRRLEQKDAPLMLEWMHNQSVVKDLRTDFLSKTIQDCEHFIENSWNDERNWNRAITDDDDVYMGTISLKNLNNRSAEFGITIRKAAMGRGYAITAMKEVIRMGFEEMGLEKIYWCVSSDNKRAVRFYDKNGFQRINACELDMIVGYTEEQIKSYIWYLIRQGTK